MEVQVQVMAENPITGECTHTNTAYLVYVALDEDGHPAVVPPLIPETEAQRQRILAPDDERRCARHGQLHGGCVGLRPGLAARAFRKGLHWSACGRRWPLSVSWLA